MYSALAPDLLVATRAALQSTAMADPRTWLTAQDLTYAATALHAEGRRAEAQARDPNFVSMPSIFEGAARTYDALVCEAREVRGAVVRADSNKPTGRCIINRHGN